ncbi:MAG: rhomboid family intramembrane serine protease [Planctomycetes bacterium]|nr:rhomboid family intramembrane serine protease [Planctomycetota bacterium]
MGYEDRDYFQSKPKFELSTGIGPATKGLLIAMVGLYLGALIAGNATNFATDAFHTSSTEGAVWVRRLFVLTPLDVNTWMTGFQPGYWKLATHWLVPIDLLAAVLGGVAVFFAGRMVEELFGWRRFLLMFVGACVISGLLATLVDPLVLRGRPSIVMGPSGGAFAMFTTVAWIAPNQRTFMGWRLRPVVLTMVGVFAALSLVTGALSGAPRVQSPTQLAWAVLIAVSTMMLLKSRGLLPAPAPGSYEEAWNRRGNRAEDVDPVALALAQARKDEERDRAEALKKKELASIDQQKLDGILEKISRQGISSLSRGERTFLDEQSKRRKP